MQLASLSIPDVKLLTTERFADDRGFFCESYNKRALHAVGIVIDFVQDNHSFSKFAGTVRGLHFQVPPFEQDKLVRVLRGRILDVAVDIRRGSPTFGQYVAAELTAEAWNQMFIPKGFAHAYCTLENATEVLYKTSNYYAPGHESGVLWNDADLQINWPYDENEAILSDKDRQLPQLRDLRALPFYAPPQKST
jgi:dTDP-4-dehydrorhamnose 3,5-epimerase